MFRFDRKFFFLFVALFIVEILIALFLHDRFVRPYVGDYLVVIMLYCFAKSFLKTGSVKLALGVLLFSYIVEILQYLNFIRFLGLQNNRLASTVMGHSFEWADLLAYTLGIATVLILERARKSNSVLFFLF